MLLSRNSEVRLHPWTAPSGARIIRSPYSRTAPMSSPTVPSFQYEIGALMARGDLAGAARMAAGCRAAWPSDRTGWLLGSIAALLEDRKDIALSLVEERLAADPHDVQCLLQKAECLLALGARAEGLVAADAAAADATDVPSLDAVGEFLVHAGEHQRALEIHDRAVAAAPNDPTLRAKRAAVHRFLGNFELAASDYEAVLVMLPTSPRALKGLVELRRQSSEHNSVAAMEAALAAAASGSTDAAILHFGLAKSYEDLGEYATSWGHLANGNRLERARLRYDSAADRTAMDRIIAGFPNVEAVTPDSTGERPIFIIGVPRTGTTLVDRIIGSHSQVHSAGELPAMSEAIYVEIELTTGARSPDWQQYTAAIGNLDGKIVAREYLARARAQRGDRPRFTDKELTNFFYCGLILRAFPNARIVHLTRHPLAACYAIYRNRFNGTWPFSYDLTEIGEFYVGYRRLMAHWHQVLPNRILDVAYEDVVTALEPTTRRLLAYLDLPFEAGCLEFHRNPAPVVTASSVQVRQPLYDSALHMWQHYAAQLAPLRAQLEAAGIPID
jgi:tetratricopeptide (TPR) repeat protein